MQRLALAVVVPTFNERENVVELLGRLERVLEGIAYEVIVETKSRYGSVVMGPMWGTYGGVGGSPSSHKSHKSHPCQHQEQSRRGFPRRLAHDCVCNNDYGQTPVGTVNDSLTVTVVPLTVAEAPWPTP